MQKKKQWKLWKIEQLPIKQISKQFHKIHRDTKYYIRKSKSTMGFSIKATSINLINIIAMWNVEQMQKMETAKQGFSVFFLLTMSIWSLHVDSTYGLYNDI